MRALADDDPRRAIDELEILIKRSEVGLRLVSGWRVVLAGRPNVGKSRLLNALAGYDRAIVDPTPGTTRDVVTIRTALDGWSVELSDTAGLRAGGRSSRGQRGGPGPRISPRPIWCSSSWTAPHP